MNNRFSHFRYHFHAYPDWLFKPKSPAGQTILYGRNNPLEERVKNALSLMTLEEKVAICHAQSKFSSKGVPRLGIPEVWMSDGPHGVREEILWDSWSEANGPTTHARLFRR